MVDFLNNLIQTLILGGIGAFIGIMVVRPDLRGEMFVGNEDSIEVAEAKLAGKMELVEKKVA